MGDCSHSITTALPLSSRRSALSSAQPLTSSSPTMGVSITSRSGQIVSCFIAGRTNTNRPS
jgi:hypothetical protein